MILTFLIFLTATLAASWKPGQTFSYNYESKVDTLAEQSNNEEQTTTFELNCKADFTVVSVEDDGAYIKMTINNVKSTVSCGNEKSSGQYNKDSEAYYARPMYFTQKSDGSLTDVTSHVDDDEDVVTLKSTILYSLQTRLSESDSLDYFQIPLISTIGSYFGFFQTTKDKSKRIVTQHFSEQDVLAFLDQRTTSEQLTLDQSTTHEIVGDDILTARSTMRVVSNRKHDLSNGDPTEIRMVTSGSSQLSGLAKKTSMDTSFPYSSRAEFLSTASEFHLVPYFQPSWYQNRVPVTTETMERFEAPGCLGDIDLCKGFEHTWVVGGPNAGLKLMAQASAGIMKGCKATQRSYMVGAYLEIDVLVLGKTIYAGRAHAEWGMMYDQPLRNDVEVTLFGFQVYHKDLPWINCIDNTITLGSFQKDFSFTYSVIVYIVTLNFQIGIDFGLKADLSYSVCPQNLKASVVLTPSARATLHGGAYASVAIARAGIEIDGTVRDNLDPTAFVDGNICQVGFSMYNNLDPIDVKLVGWFEVKTIKGFKITWGKRHEHVFWRYQYAGRRDKIIDLLYSAK